MLGRKGRRNRKHRKKGGTVTNKTTRKKNHDTMDDSTHESVSGSPRKDNSEPVTFTMDLRCGASPLASACVPSSGENLQGLAEIGVLSSVPRPEPPFQVLR